jgi:hypothetical protein
MENLKVMFPKSSPAKLVLVREFLNQQIKNREPVSDYGEHASVLRKPEVIAGHPPDLFRFNNLPHGSAGELVFLPRSYPPQPLNKGQ